MYLINTYPDSDYEVNGYITTPEIDNIEHYMLIVPHALFLVSVFVINLIF
jgi:hypothetical protein